MRDALELSLGRAHKGRKKKKQAIAEKVTDLAVDGVGWATELVFDRIDGKPTQHHEVEGAIALEVKDARERLASRLDALAERRREKKPPRRGKR